MKEKKPAFSSFLQKFLNNISYYEQIDMKKDTINVFLKPRSPNIRNRLSKYLVFTKHQKYVVKISSIHQTSEVCCQNLQYFNGFNFREVFVRIRVFCSHLNLFLPTRYLYLHWPFLFLPTRYLYLHLPFLFLPTRYLYLH